MMRLDSSTLWVESGPNAYAARLPGGEFRFQIKRADLKFTDLCDVAIRNNPRRRFLFVSRVLGRHWPVRPAALVDVASRLTTKVVDLGIQGPVVFIGMAETATILGQAVFREWRRRGMEGLYIESTRRATGGEIAFRFSETHSHASAHLIHRPGPEDDPEDLFRRARQVVIVDDEATTGATAAALARSLREWRCDASLCASLAAIVRWNTPAGEAADLDRVISLAEGCFEFSLHRELAVAPTPRDEIGLPVPTRRGARHGICEPETMPAHWDSTVRSKERVLVLGNGEHGFRPLLFAETLERHGAVAWVQATTRSPILPGGAIGHVREFPALSREDHREYLYNVPDDHPYDRLILCIEDEPPPAEHPIWEIPRLEVRA